MGNRWLLSYKAIEFQQWPALPIHSSFPLRILQRTFYQSQYLLFVPRNPGRNIREFQQVIIIMWGTKVFYQKLTRILLKPGKCCFIAE
jgi:hypothetical protein